jgi:hypothetical protein
MLHSTVIDQAHPSTVVLQTICLSRNKGRSVRINIFSLVVQHVGHNQENVPHQQPALNSSNYRKSFIIKITKSVNIKTNVSATYNLFQIYNTDMTVV